MNPAVLHPECAEFLLGLRVPGVSVVNIQGDCTLRRVAPRTCKPTQLSGTQVIRAVRSGLRSHRAPTRSPDNEH